MCKQPPFSHNRPQTNVLSSSSVIAAFYPTSTPDIPASKSTALASALFSVQSSWVDSPVYTSVQNAIYSAAPSSVQASISSSGYIYESITTNAWFTKVPQALQSAVTSEFSALDNAAESIIGTSTSTGGAARVTEVALAGAVGVVGVAMALL